MASPGSHVRDFVQQIDNTSWLIGAEHILRYTREPCETDKCLWKGSSDGSSYTISLAPDPLPDAGPLPVDGHVRKIHDAGDQSAVFRFGDALILKVRLATEGTRREPRFLNLLAEKQLSFGIPTTLLHGEVDGKLYLFLPYISGSTINDLWCDMTDEEKEQVTSRVANVCKDLKAMQSKALTAVDHHWMDPFREKRDYQVKPLQKHCESLGMDCSTFVFSHNDLGPTNIIINEDRIYVIDWEMAGYVPEAWIRTKFAICGALDVERDGAEPDGEYRMRVERKLGEMGFPQVTEAYNTMHEARYEEWVKRRPWLFE